MSIFADILHKIFPPHHPAVTSAQAPAPAPTAAPTASTRAPAPPPATAAGTTSTATAGKTAGAPGSSAPAAPPAAAPAQPAAAQPVDVEAVLSAMAQKSSQPLNWRTSIVDLMKLLGLDSSLTARQSLAKELGYTGDMHDSASMNIWLQKQVMKKLAENGGKVPAELQH